jgi:transposase-like protein
MAENLEIRNIAVSLLIRAALLAARFSGRVRRRSLQRLVARDADAKAKEILSLKDRVYQLEMQVSILQRHLHKKGRKPRYEVRERLLILWHMEALQIPRRRVSRYFGIARSTLYRWLYKIEDQKPPNTAANETPTEIAALVWKITRTNLSWGRIRIANQLKLLGIFLAVSTVRNIVQRPKPRSTPTSAAPAEKAKEKAESRSIPASYPNHVWSVDTTKVLRWGLWDYPGSGGDRPLTLLYTELEHWYNAWRPHMTLEGLRPDELHYSRKPETSKRNAKTVPGDIEHHVFAETRLTAYRLKNVA